MGSFRNTEREYAVYSTMEEPTLPVIYADINGYYANVMHGYMQDMGNKAASDSITPLPEDRRLKLKINLYDNALSELSYEVRSLDLEHYIEKTEVSSVSAGEDGAVYAELPIQNMIEKDTPYLLTIRMTLGERSVNYYTRIIWTDSDDIYRMIETATDFTTKTFDYDSARDLTVYLEADDRADNTTLDTVGIGSSFSQITWADSDMELSGELEVNVREYDGQMGAVEVRYMTESAGESGDDPDTYENCDEFTLRAGSDRIYMMNYQRQTSQIFAGSKHLFAGNRIRLGIMPKDRIMTAKSENGRYIVFKADRELWSYDQESKKAVNIFSFRSENDRVRASNDEYDIKILYADDSGDVDFMVYGYMNRGRHEGYNGAVYYRYNSHSDSIEEIFFIPIAEKYDSIRLEINELCTKSDSGMVYIKQGDAVTAIDGTSLEMMSVASDLEDGRFASSHDQKKIAWIEGDSYAENSIRFMDISTGQTETITAQEGTVLSIIGFYNDDLIYGERGINDNRIVNGKIKGRPVYALHIVDPELNSVMEYTRDGYYFEDIRLEDNRIHIAQYKKGSDPNEFVFVSRDTIVSSETEEDTSFKYISSAQSDTKERIYYVDLDENIRTTRNLDVTAPQNISYERSGNIDIGTAKRSDSIRFRAFANGRLVGISYSLKDAIDLCYDSMGWICDENGAVMYSRADKARAYTIREPYSAAEPLLMAAEDGELTESRMSSDGCMILDAQGIELNRLMYYINKGNPIMVSLTEGKYCLIYAYDSDSIGVFYPSETDEQSSRVSMTMEEAAQYFAGYQSDYTCFIRYPGR